MELLQLEYFIMAARLEHFSKAAAELNISPSTLSLAIRRLEYNLGVPLFEANGRNVKLTPYGILLQNEISPIIEKISSVETNIHKLKQNIENRITIIMPSGVSLSNPLIMMQRNFPDATICKVLYPLDVACQMLLDGEADLFLPLLDGTEKLDEKLECRILKTNHMVAIFSKEMPLSGRKSITWKALHNMRIISHIRGIGTRDILERKMANNGYVTNVVYEGNNFIDMLQMASALNCTLIAAKGILSEERMGNLVEVPIEDSKIILAMLWKKGNQRKAVQNAILNMEEYYKAYSKV